MNLKPGWRLHFEKVHVLFLSFLLVIFVSASGYAQEVGVAWVGKSGMANRVNQGLTDALKTLAPDVKLEHHKELPQPMIWLLW